MLDRNKTTSVLQRFFLLASFRFDCYDFICLFRVAVHWDITFGKLASPDWVTLGAHFFHPSLHSMVTLATMDFDQNFKMDYRVGLLFWKMVDAAVLKFSCLSGRQNLKLDPFFLVADGQGSLWKSARLHWGLSESPLQGREQTCEFHFEQGLKRLLLVFSSKGSASHRDEFCDLVMKLIYETDLSETVKLFQRYIHLMWNVICLHQVFSQHR